ncbi:helix-turn-helix domain-containing protein [Aquibacillus albus]|uniref:AraC-like DNA-binding protein n=1 Tax=Aquibacillus albus TaxID=1168171 RepID=A0ABS2N1D0_9BACI|nr:helix-turn-helix domain-containing protein [Aquibacillus albus]MBM7571863.1 AraC-like DNA-binding protein [Aquibacillus albus]
MISISGNALDYWNEHGIEDNERLLAVNCCGYQKLITKDLTRQRDNGRVDFQIIYIVGGQGTFYFENKHTYVSSGQIVVYSPNQSQHYSYYARDYTEAYWIHFTGYAAQEYLEQFGLLNSSIHTVGMMNEVVALFEKIIYELNMNKPLSEHMTTANLIELLTLLGRKLQNKGNRLKSDYHEDINNIIQIMHEQYNKNLIIEDLAKMCSLSIYRFIHKFKAVTGTTPIKYITSVRINEAKSLLSETSLSVQEVASVVGYHNPLYFSRVFRNAVGMPPSSYKEQFH